MAQSQHKSKRKASGARYHSSRTKRKYELARFPANTKVGEDRRIKTKRTPGGNTKYSVLVTKDISVSDQKGKTQKTEVVTVLENPANPNLVRRNVLTMGAIVETKLGKARITSRPGQEGAVSAVLL